MHKLKPTNIIALILLLIPILSCVWFIHKFGVNVPLWDEWTFINEVLVKFYNGSLHFSDLLNVQGNEHKVFVPFVIMLFTSILTKYNCITNMYVGFLFMLLTELVVIALIWANTSTWRHRILMFVPLGLVMCDFRQRENLLMGMQICFFATCFFFVLTIFFIDKFKNNWLYFLFAISSAICATYSEANGLLVWPLVFFQLLFTAKTKKILWLWILAALFVLFTYYYKYDSNPTFYGHFQWAFLFSKPLETCQFFLALIGNPFSGKSSISIIAGLLYLLVLGLQLYLLLKYSEDRKSLMIPVILVLFWILTDVLILYGRVQMGIDQALVSRYSTFGNIGFAGLYAMCLMPVSKHMVFKKAVLVIFCTFVVFALLVSSADALCEAKIQRQGSLKLQAILRSYSLQSDKDLSYLFTDIPMVKKLANLLEQNHLNVFAQE